MAVIDWIQTNSAFVVAIATVVLVVVTAFYAWQTFALAKEMRKQRFDAVRPIIDLGIFIDHITGPGLWEAQKEYEGDVSNGLTCSLLNIGAGPAIDLRYFAIDRDAENRRYQQRDQMMEVQGRVTAVLGVDQEKGRYFLVALYRDSYLREFQSKRELIRDKERLSWTLGNLEVSQIGEGISD